jgi:hypothetical protein
MFLSRSVCAKYTVKPLMAVFELLYACDPVVSPDSRKSHPQPTSNCHPDQNCPVMPMRVSEPSVLEALTMRGNADFWRSGRKAWIVAAIPNTFVLYVFWNFSRIGRSDASTDIAALFWEMLAEVFVLMSTLYAHHEHVESAELLSDLGRGFLDTLV